MISETEYSIDDLVMGKCKSCNVRTQVTKDVVGVPEEYVGWCPDCIEADTFYDATMK